MVKLAIIYIPVVDGFTVMKIGTRRFVVVVTFCTILQNKSSFLKLLKRAANLSDLVGSWLVGVACARDWLKKHFCQCVEMAAETFSAGPIQKCGVS